MLPKVSTKERRKLWNVKGLFFVCPMNIGYLKLNGIRQAAKQIPLLPKSSCLKRLSRLKENLTSLLNWKNSKKNSWKRMECLLL
uniref:Uncharacterized protein n=1 Tax=Brassica oleracea TaxID=3712 RepID=A0A3P6EBD8_BRAOL|nr:unnamed protein product [Brassica oleracea]